MSGPDWAPAPQRVIDSAEAIKAMADPLRLKLLQLLMSTSERAWSVKEMAGALDQSVTKLYHHVKILESAALITDVETRVVSGIVEHRYRASAKSLRFDDSLYGAPETRPDAIAQIAAVVETARDDLLDYLNRDDADIDRVSVSRATLRLTPSEVATVNTTIDDLVAGFVEARQADDRSSMPRTTMLFMLHPVANPPE
jgi:DNA-binding transcriptional ArsR family regulator